MNYTILAVRSRSTRVRRTCGCTYWQHARRVLCIHDVRRILARVRQGETKAAVAAEYDIHPTGISHIEAGRYWLEA